MKAELKQKWIEALRSGEYKQGRMYLRDTSDRYCCLGVLVDVSGFQWGTTHKHAYQYGFHSDLGYRNCTGLNDQQQVELGIDYDTMNKLMGMNDGQGATFTEIANWIDQHIPAE